MTEAGAILPAIQSAAAISDCIRICHKAYREISNFIQSLKEMGHDVAELQQRFKEEECRMWTFALARNLVVDEDHPIDVVATGLPQFWVEVVDTRLALVKKHLEEAEELVNKYIGKAPSSKTKPTQGKTIGSAPATQNPSVEPKEVARYTLERRPTESPSVLMAQATFQNQSTAVQETGLRSKLRWSFQDKKILDKTIEKLEKDNDVLWKLIEPNQMNMMADAVSSKMSSADLKLISTRITPNSDRNEGDSMRQEYERRIQEQGQARTYIATLDEETISQKMGRSLDISYFSEIQHAQLPDKRTRMLTIYHCNNSNVEVLVEWKEWNPNLIARNEVIARVSNIVAILNSPPKCIGNILSSPGFLEDSRGNSRGTKWIGIVYNTTSLGYKPRIRTMRDILTRSRENVREMWKPPLGDRFRLAHQLAETLLAVHNCGWLHKGLRPENIVFFSVAKTVNNPYLLGWDSSRSSKRGQSTTEPVISWHKDLELYQHPLWFEEPSLEDEDKSRFRIEFDHYQLGCVLLEIGLWCLIGDLKQAKGDAFSGPNWRDDWKIYLENKTRVLEVEMGKIYSEVVLKLLQGLNANGRNLEYWNVIVRQLSKCKA